MKWTDLYVEGRRVLLSLKKELIYSGVGTRLQWYNIFLDIPDLWTFSHTFWLNRWIPMMHLYMLNCGLQIGGEKCRWLSLYGQIVSCHIFLFNWLSESTRESESEHVRESVLEKTCQREHVRACLREPIRGSMSERACQREHGREIVSQRTYQWSHDRANVLDIPSECECIGEYVSKIVTQSMSRVCQGVLMPDCQTLCEQVELCQTR